ncbi:MAG TPA: tetratricopeptide repeat protein, partial [Burkholderiaceae bacterium]
MLAGVLQARGDGDAAIAARQAALALQPHLEPCRRDQVRALVARGDAAAALTLADEGLRIEPRSVALLLGAGEALAGLGRWRDAAERVAAACSAQPGVSALWCTLGDARKAAGERGPAIEAYRRAVVLAPSDAALELRLGAALHADGQIDAALTEYRRALALDATLAEAHSNMAAALKAKGDVEGAIASGRSAVALRPDSADAHTNLGNALQVDGDLVGAVAAYQRALQLRTDAVAHNNLAGALINQGRIDEALQLLEEALRLQPGYAAAESNRLFALNYHPDKSAAEIFQGYRAFEARLVTTVGAPTVLHGNDRRVDRRLRVGYVSADFRHHPVRYFLEPLLSQHDKTAVEVWAYAEGVEEDATTARYRACVDHWVPTTGLDDEALARRIAADGIDILVDLAGHTGQNRLATLARKPAPVSLSWLGFGYTTGLRSIDYFLTDTHAAPPGSEALFAETPWRLGGSCFVYRPAEMGEVGPLPALGNGHVTFGSLTRAIRMNAHTVRAWSRILQRVPGSRLVVDSQNYKQTAMQQALVERFAAHGIARERLDIGFRFPAAPQLRRLDIALDCFPHNSGTTLFESLWMGLPFVTLAGRPSVGRLGSSILQGLGRSEWIAEDEDGYVERAVALASDLPALAALRAGLREQMRSSALM